MDPIIKDTSSNVESDLYQQLFNNVHVGVLIADKNRQLKNANQRFCSLFGYSSPQEFIGQPAAVLHLSEDHFLRFGELFFDKVIANEPLSVRYPMKRKDGNCIWVLISGEPTPERDLVIWTIVDITEQKKMEEEQAKLLAAIAQTEEIIVITDADANIQYVNKAFESVTGYSTEEVIGQNPRILQGGENDEGFYKKLWGTLTNGQPWKGRFTNKKKDGTLYVEEATISPVRDVTGKIVNYVAAKSDITERLQTEQQLRQKHKMEAVGYMAGGMAHNFNNNLSIILGNLELSQMKLQPSNEVISFLENAKIAVRRSRDLVQNIITYSRKGIQNKVPTTLVAITDETISLLQATLPSTINLQKSYHPDCQIKQVNADPSQIQEVLINLCNNAVHAMDEKGALKIELEPVDVKETEITAMYNCPPGRYSKVSVQDSGCGMPAEMLDKIFDPFYSTKEEYEGAGMGLSTVQGIVAQHGGMIKVNSIINQGTTFELYFPIIENTSNDISTTGDDSQPRGTEQILYVDDDEMQTNMVKQMLSAMGYRVSVMNNSQEALKLFTANAENIDIVISDQTMPNLCGKDFIQEIKKIRADIPTVLCTGYSSKIDEDEAAKLGISAFMMKPLDLPQLSQTIRQVLDGGE